MSEPLHQGVMAMVKIDGGRVRRLREQKSLTQLYIATSVQVTTDTISRWENRRYPTIKRENALKLAEALEVELEDILEKQEEETPVGAHQDSETPPPDTPTPAYSAKNSGRFPWPILLLSATMAAIMAFVGWVFLLPVEQDTTTVTSTRKLPEHCTPGQVFPVKIEVHVSSDNPLAFIVKEELPEGAQVVDSLPPLSGSGKNGNKLKWLTKGTGKQTFTYAVVISTAFDEADEFQGTIAINDQSEVPHTTTGNNRVMVTSFHWADSNRDYIISDSEILAVYDSFGEADSFDIDLDLIEEIWLGSGYKWNPDTKSYDILP